MQPEILKQIVEEFIPFNKFLGIKVASIREGFAVLEIPFRPEFVGDSLRPALHGGVISTLADTAGGIAIWCGIDPRGRVSTIDLRVDYLRPGRAETLCAEATVVRRGSRVGVVDIRLFHPDAPADTIATGKGVYNIKLVKQKAE